MLRKKNNGSILIMSLITLFIVTLICTTCSSLILSNNRISELEYKTEKLKENNLGAIEIIKSNIINEVKYNMENNQTEEEFYNYISKNNHTNFINKAKSISRDYLKNIYVEMVYDSDKSTNQFTHYKISVKNKINNYEKYSFIKVKIENPYFDKIKNTPEKVNTNEVLNESYKDDEYISEDDYKNVEIDESDLVTFYNYEEK